MRPMFYARLAVDGMRKNRRLYLPYFMTCILMVTVFYILAYLGESELVSEMRGGGSTQITLRLGVIVIAVFSAVFLFYTNSFLMRRRRKEFGLYNVLGMTKRNVGRILLWETFICFAVTVIVGLGVGIALSKLAELGLMQLIQGDVTYTFTVPLKVVRNAFVYFAAVFVPIFFNGLRQVHFSQTVELLKSENTGEKPPKANWVLGVLGVVILGAAYWLAVKIQEPLEALLFFFVAVIMVIIATYLIFIAGSVAMCRILQKKKSFYYKAKNFVSVSSMAYRMKRNGAGLASICILLTMVLVMLSGSACLYFGKDVALKARYPRDICAFATWYGYGDTGTAVVDNMNAAVEEAVSPEDVTDGSEVSYFEYTITGYLEDSHVGVVLSSLSNMAFIAYDQIAEVHFIRLDDYNRIYGEHETLAPGEAIVCAVKTDDVGDVFSVEDAEFRVVKRIDGSALDFNGASLASVTANIFVIVNDIDDCARHFLDYTDYDGTPMLLLRWYYQFDSELPVSEQTELARSVEVHVNHVVDFSRLEHPNFYVDCHKEQESDFYGTFGGLFFIGILLSLVFLISAALIIYYKQICEGYEDEARFDIMQKVGMTSHDIRKSINAQMLIVFFLPIGLAIVHLGFAFPVINKLLMLFSVFHVPLLIATTAAAALVCTLFYAVVYRLTSNAYYRIVSGGRT